jgi:hypothetical protein
MPIRLATAAGPAGDAIGNGEYVFNPATSYWKMSRYDSSNNSISDCNWTFTSDNTRIGRAITDIGRSPVTDYSLQDCGIYVKTVDFSNDWEDAAYWRSIHENSTITGGGISPRLTITAPSEAKRTFYVWSEPYFISSANLTFPYLIANQTPYIEASMAINTEGPSKIEDAFDRFYITGGLYGPLIFSDLMYNFSTTFSFLPFRINGMATPRIAIMIVKTANQRAILEFISDVFVRTSSRYSSISFSILSNCLFIASFSFCNCKMVSC